MLNRRRIGVLGVAGLALLPLLAAGAGAVLASDVLHPMRRPLSPNHVKIADEVLARAGATREEFEVRVPDAVSSTAPKPAAAAPLITLRGWKLRPARDVQGAKPANGDWVLCLHGVSDHRLGVIGHAEMLLRHGYSVLLMDMRGHGASNGATATYGWLERHDVRAIADALYASESVRNFFLLGESMGAAIALQAAEVEPRVAGVVAESAFANLKEISFDYAGLRMGAWLGRTLFRPAAIMGISGVEKEGGFRAEDVSPERAVAARAFPVLLICGRKDRNIPPRHTERIYKAAIGPKEMWLVPGACHTCALGAAPEEFQRRVVNFFSSAAVSNKH